jgi:hypothetical protein
LTQPKIAAEPKVKLDCDKSQLSKDSTAQLHLWAVDPEGKAIDPNDIDGVTYKTDAPEKKVTVSASGKVTLNDDADPESFEVWAEGEINNVGFTTEKLRISVSDGKNVQAAKPVPSVAPGRYNEKQTVDLSSGTDDSEIYYTTDGSEPTKSSDKYDKSIELASDTTIKAIAVKDGFIDSDIAEYRYFIHTPPTESAEEVTAETEKDDETELDFITLSTETEDAQIYYTIDGKDPSPENGILYTGKIALAGLGDSGRKVTINAVACRKDLLNSSVTNFDYTIPKLDIKQMEQPSVNIEAGTYENPQFVRLNSNTEETEIYYTTDGETPSKERSPRYITPILISSDTTLKAIAVKSDTYDSKVLEAAYVIDNQGGKSEGEITIDDITDAVNTLSKSPVISSTVDMVIDIERAKESLSEKYLEQIPEETISKLESLQEQVSGILHNVSGLSVSGVDWYVELKAVPENSSSSAWSTVKSKISSKSLVSLYDVELVNRMTGQKVIDSNAMISVPQPSSVKYIAITQASDTTIHYPKFTSENNKMTFALGDSVRVGVARPSSKSSDHHDDDSNKPNTPKTPETPVQPNQSYVSDTTRDFSVNSTYQFRITSKNGKVPVFVVGTPGVFNVALVKHIGGDYYFKITAIGAPGDKAGIYINGEPRLLVATVGANPDYAKLDTGKQLTVKAGKTYQFKVTALKKPTFVCGNGSVFRLKSTSSKGNNYFFKFITVGKPGDCAGFYLNREKTPRTIGLIS